jgi:hypothetical protein
MFLSRLRAAVGIVAFLLIAGFLHYSLPSRDIVRIVGTDVVRKDVERRDAQGDPVTMTRDVRFIYAKWPGGGDRVYRNEDTGWGWPPYFKFDTANLAAAATDLVSASDAPEWVVIRHYGWRVLTVLIARRMLIILFMHHVDPVIDEIDREIDERSGAVRRGYRRIRRWFRHCFGF